MNLDSWAIAKENTDYLGNAVWAFGTDRWPSNTEQRQCFAKMNAAGIKLQLEVGVLKPDGQCLTASACFNAALPIFNRLKSNGANVGMVMLDEPLCAVLLQGVPGGYSYALDQTRQYIGMLHGAFPSAKVAEQEPYPAISESTLYTWITDLSQSGANRPSYFELDEDLNDGRRNPSESRALKNHTESSGLGFSLLYAYTARATPS